METIYTNCSIVTRTEVFSGSIQVEDGRIKAISRGGFSGKGAVDLGGDLLLPGLIEMHTDNLEKNIQPRPGVIWPSMTAAVLAHDAQIIAAGITTVYDAVAVGGLRESSLREKIFEESISAICKSKRQNILKADHFLHLRCELSHEQLEQLLHRHGERPEVRLISVMDHTPGQRQWTDLSKWRLYHRDKRWTDEDAAKMLDELKAKQQKHAGRNRQLTVAFAHQRNIPLASHDDTTAADVEQAVAEKIDIAEFPTTPEAAAKAKQYNITTILGAPNAVRGVSHSGNASALQLAQDKLLDGLSSDYVPSSLLQAVFHLADRLQCPLNETVNMVSSVIADTLRLTDRGELAPGKRADMLQIRMVDNIPVLRRAWVGGEQVA